MALTDAQIRTLKPVNKQFKKFDGNGLLLLVKPNGSKLFQGKYRFNGKERLASYGPYPDISLKEARIDHEKLRALLRQGIDPANDSRLPNSDPEHLQFKTAAEEWYQNKLPAWAAATVKKRRALLDNDLLPWLGDIPFSEITPTKLLKALRRIEGRGALDTARNAQQVLNDICRYAVWTQRITSNPASDLQGALKPFKTKHRPAIVEPTSFGQLLRKLESYQGRFQTKMLLQILPLVFQRPGNVRQMEWVEIHWDKAEWRIPASKMKMREDHIVPLSKQALSILNELQPLTGRYRYVFSNQSNKTERCASENTINKALRTLGVDTSETHCAHGFRASARTMLDEQLDFPIELIEHQLAHTVKDALGRAYNRTKHLPQRLDMMQKWADYLDKVKEENLPN